MIDRSVMACRVSAAVALFLGVSVGMAQQGASPESNKPLLTFDADAVLLTVLIKPEKTADFEFVLAKLKEASNKSEKPERSQQAAGWQVYKASQPLQGNAVYVMRIEPVVRGQEYDISRLIAEAFPVEVQDIFPKYRDAFAGRVISEITPFMTMW